jgi:hypothetical protein
MEGGGHDHDRVRATLNSEQLFEFMVHQSGNARLYMGSILESFLQCRRSGLDSSLATWVTHRSFRDDALPEDIGSSEFLCVAGLLQESDGEVGELVARHHLEILHREGKSITDEDADKYVVRRSLQTESVLTAKAFQNLFVLLAQLLRLDEMYIINHFIWVLNGRFEMTDGFFRQLLLHCAQTSVEGPVESEVVHLTDFLRTLRNIGLIDEHEKRGLPNGVWNLLFITTVRDMPRLRNSRPADPRSEEAASQKRGSMDKDQARITVDTTSPFLVGKTEVSILIEATYKALIGNKGLAGARSPLQMCVAWIQKSRSTPAVT